MSDFYPGLGNLKKQVLGRVAGVGVHGCVDEVFDTQWFKIRLKPIQITLVLTEYKLENWSQYFLNLRTNLSFAVKFLAVVFKYLLFYV